MKCWVFNVSCGNGKITKQNGTSLFMVVENYITCSKKYPQRIDTMKGEFRCLQQSTIQTESRSIFRSWSIEYNMNLSVSICIVTYQFIPKWLQLYIIIVHSCTIYLSQISALFPMPTPTIFCDDEIAETGV